MYGKHHSMKQVVLIILSASLFSYGSDCKDSVAQMQKQAVESYNNIQNGLKSKDSQERLFAVQQIRELGSVGIDVYKRMIPLLQDIDPRVQKTVVEVFGEHRTTETDVSHALLYLKSQKELPEDIKSAIDKSLRQISAELKQKEKDLWEKIENAVTLLYSVVGRKMNIQLSKDHNSNNLIIVVQDSSQKQPKKESERIEMIRQVFMSAQYSVQELDKLIRTIPFSSFREFMGFIHYYKNKYNQQMTIPENIEDVIRQIYSHLEFKT